MNLPAVLVTGLFAGGMSCATVQGGLLTGLITRQHAATTHPPTTPRSVQDHINKAGNARADKGASGALQTAHRRTRREQLGDDLAPVGGFLAGKLVSHTLLGALLGALGAAVALSVGARTLLQIGAGLMILAFGLAQLGVPGFHGIVTPAVLDDYRAQPGPLPNGAGTGLVGIGHGAHPVRGDAVSGGVGADIGIRPRWLIP